MELGATLAAPACQWFGGIRGSRVFRIQLFERRHAVMLRVITL
jgi:hypothetical protein